jgi:hypothetical protein
MLGTEGGSMKIKRTFTETLDIPDDLSLEEAAILLQNPGAQDDDDDLDGEDDDDDDLDGEDDDYMDDAA